MNPNEFRLGSIVYHYDVLCDIYLISKDKIYVESLDRLTLPFTNASGITPVPLTDEWLYRFGFSDKPTMPSSVIFVIDVLDTVFYLRPSCFGGYYWGFIEDETKQECELFDAQPIQYVHQLQNLYFALTGEELIV
jgi:hypothetical protein